MAYTVKTGDTLSKIASAQGTTVAKIIAANPFLMVDLQSLVALFFRCQHSLEHLLD